MVQAVFHAEDLWADALSAAGLSPPREGEVAMDWHLRLSAAAPGFRLVRLLNCWCLYDAEDEFCGRFRTHEEAIRTATRLAKEEAKHG